MRRKPSVGVLSILGFGLAWSVMPPRVTANHPSSRIVVGFEASEGYLGGSAIEAMEGWSISEEARGAITEEDFLFGEQSLRIEAGETSVGVEYWAEEIPQQGVRFIEASVKPIPGEGEEALISLSLWGSEVRFTQGVGPAIELQLPGNEPPETISIPVGDGNDGEGPAVPWVSLVVRQDLQAGTWDLFLNGELIAIDLGLVESNDSLQLEVGARETIYLDGLGVGKENPLFPDSDGDGMSDAYEVAHRLNPHANDRNGDRDGDGISNIAEARAGTFPSFPGSGTPGPILYVDNATGSDANSGKLPHGSGNNGPKFSIKAAMAAAESGTVIVVLPGTGIYNEGSRSANGKRITIRTVQPIIIK